MNYVIGYDITDNKRRKKVSDLLEGYGVRVNYSLFEVKITKTNLKKLLLQILKIVDKKEDSIRFYHICKNCEEKSFEVCDNIGLFEEKEFFI
jgi:CRISPR-associated protein Cas2